jgi:signal transduction histidine kinase
LREIPEELRTELTARFLRNFQHVLFWSLALQCAVTIPLFAARKFWAFVIVVLVLVLVLALPRRLLHQDRIRSAGWLLAASALVLGGGFTVVSGGIRSPAVFTQLSLIVAATLILGLRGTLLLAIPFMTLDLGLAVYQASGRQLPIVFPAPPIISWFILLGAIIMMVSNVHLALIWLGEVLGERRRMFDRLRELTSHQEDVREEERRRIAREIHEDLGQQLTAVKLRVVLLSRDLPSDNADALAQVGTLSHLLDDAVQIVRGIASELRPSVLDILGLKAALEWLAEEFHRSSGLPCTADLEAIQADAPTAIAIFRVAQEALTNVTKHAQATRIWITLKEDGNAVALTIRDNGRGLKPEDLTKSGSFGVAGMRERATSKGGTFEVAPSTEGGTILKLRLPAATVARLEPAPNSPRAPIFRLKRAAR